MNQDMPVDLALRRRNRLMLIGVMLAFLLPVTAATLLHWSGWKPSHTGNHGELLNPPVSVADLALHTASGERFEYAPHERRWQIVVVPPADCQASCTELIASLNKVWQLQGRRADRLHVLWFGPVAKDAAVFRTFTPMQSQAELETRLPGLSRAGLPSLYLLDPAGFLAMRYAPGTDVADIRADIARLLK